MKICDLTYAYIRHGGVTTYINNKKLFYQKNKIEHLIISPREDILEEIKVIAEGTTRIYLVPARKINLEGVTYFFFKNFKGLEKVLRQERPDVLEIGDKFVTLFFGKKIKKLAKELNIKVFGFSHERADKFFQQIFNSLDGKNFFTLIRRKIALSISNFLIKRFINSVDYLIANSDFTAEELKLITKKPVFILPLGLNLEKFKQVEFDQNLYNRLSNNGKKEIIIHVGRLEQDKRINLLVNIAKELDHNKYTLVVLGDGKFRETLNQIKGVVTTGLINRQEVRKYLKVANLGILVNNIEPYGLVGLEMMIYGLPILGPNQGGLTSFLRKDFAWLLPYDKNAYFKALEKWEKLSSEKKKEMSQAALVAVKKYSAENTAKQLIKIYQANE